MYLRDKNWKPYATFYHESGQFGWSLCNKVDQFSKEIGRELAVVKSEPITNINLRNVPESIRTQFVEFIHKELVHTYRKRINDGLLFYAKNYDVKWETVDYVVLTDFSQLQVNIETLNAKVEVSKCIPF